MRKDWRQSWLLPRPSSDRCTDCRGLGGSCLAAAIQQQAHECECEFCGARQCIDRRYHQIDEIGHSFVPWRQRSSIYMNLRISAHTVKLPRPVGAVVWLKAASSSAMLQLPSSCQSFVVRRVFPEAGRRSWSAGGGRRMPHRQGNAPTATTFC